MTGRLAIIAGAGRFPFHVAESAKRQGLRVVAVGIHGWVDPGLAAYVDAYEEVSIGSLRRLLDSLKAHGITQAIMAGKVTKAVLLEQSSSFDAETRSVLNQAQDASVGTLLSAVAARLAQEGIALLDSSTFLQGDLCPVGVLTTRAPSARETSDIDLGQRAARAIANLDIGQTIVVKGRVIVAVEALEGTDAVIHRAHQLAGSGLVVVKVAATDHDRRFDLPVIGPETVSVLIEANVSCLALEAGVTLLLERESLLTCMNNASLCLIGLHLPSVS